MKPSAHNHLLNVSTSAQVSLTPYDLPGEALLAGDPAPRIWSFEYADGEGHKVVTGIFEADPGTIRNRVRVTETIYVLEGRVRIELDTGEAIELGPGGMAALTRGCVATWTFLESFKEFFVLSGEAA